VGSLEADSRDAVKMDIEFTCHRSILRA